MRKLFFAIALLAAGSLRAQVPITLDSHKKGAEIAPTLYGIFFEEIKFAGCGGLYAELVRNRSFEDDHGENLSWWSSYGKSTLELVTTDSKHSNMLNDVQEHAVKVTTTGNSAGLTNQGYWGMNIVKGEEYQLSFWAKGDEGTVLNARLTSEGGTVLGKVTATETLTGEWTRYTATIKATRSDGRAKLSILAAKPATFYLDVVSLFPPTFKDRPNGMRRDLAQMTADLKPAFMRFPGGCVIEGLYDNSTGKTCRVEWKKQLGPIENRLGHRNNNWGYFVDDGMGVFEYFQFAEDIGAEPLWVANMGMGHNWKVDWQHNSEALQETLDLIEFANGDVSTPYGKIRAEMGHPEPFNLKYIELGNEQNETSDGDTRDHYGERYYQFYKAIKKKDPNIQVIGCGQYNVEGWQYSYPVDMVDSHHYDTPDWFFSAFNLYDDWDRSKHKLYLGEYAVTWGGGNGNLLAALGEAVFMMGLERNGDVVKMASYAPMFSNDDSPAGWPTEMMHYNSSKSYGTPSYYIQKLFPNHLGTVNIDVTNKTTVVMPHTVGVVTWSTSATATDLSVTDNKTGEALIDADYMAKSANWTTNEGDWTINADGVTQKDNTKTNLRAISKKTFMSNHYTVEGTFTKHSGDEGFIVPFYYVDNDNYCWMNIGGWGNKSIGLEQRIGGASSVVGDMPAYNIKSGKEYRVKIVVDSLQATLYIDGSLIMRRTIKSFDRPALYAAANTNEAGDVINLRIVNRNEKAQEAVIRLRRDYVASVGGEYLGGLSSTAENTFDSPRRVVPKEITGIEADGQEIRYTVPRNSACFITIGISPEPVDAVETPAETGAVPTPDDRIYNLHGMPVADMSQRGVYIKRGRKYLK